MWCGNIKESMVSGDFKKACEEYEKITHLTKGRFSIMLFAPCSI